MGILADMEETLKRGDKLVELLQQREELFVDLLNCVSANIVVTEHNILQLLKVVLRTAFGESLSKYKDCDVVSLDCKKLTKEDAFGWMVSLAKKVEQTPNLIVVIENLAEIFNEPMCNDAQYIANLLGHSWKNEKVFFGDYCIDCSELTIIITVTQEQKMDLHQKLRTDSYYWIENFDEEFEKVQ
jgi:hypothetical protein